MLPAPPTGLPCILVLCLGVFAAACSGTSDETILTTPIQVDATAPIVLGGPAGYEFARVATGVLTADGAIIADGGGAEALLFFDSTGSLTKSVGRPGEGPGEFRSLSGLWATRDTLYANDFSLQRLSRFTPSGEFINAAVMESPDGTTGASPTGVFADGCLLRVATTNPDPPATPRVAPVTGAVFVSCRGEDTPLPGAAYTVVEDYVERTPGGVMYVSMPFGRGGGTGVVGDRIVVKSATAHELLMFDRQGRVVDSVDVTRGMRRRPVTSEHIAMVRALYASDSPGPDGAGQLFDRIPLPDSLPYFGWGPMPRRPIRAMSNGELWLLEYGGLEPGPAVWTVVAADGSLHRVALASAGEVLDVRDGRVLVRDTDADGVERLWIGRLGTS